MKRKLVFLKTDAEFAQFKRSRSYANSFLRIRVANASNQNIPRFGFIVPKRVLPKVVDRNLVKRRIKAILTREINRIRPAEILIFPTSKTVKLTFEQLNQEVLSLLGSARLWKR